MSLFRKEAVLGSTSNLAPIIIFNSKQFMHLFIATIIIFILLVGFIFNQSYAQKLALNGRLSALEVDSVFYADTSGYIGEIYYAIGDKVTKGDTILTYIPQQAFSNATFNSIEIEHNEQQIRSLKNLEARLEIQMTTQSQSVAEQTLIIDKQLETLTEQIQHYGEQVTQLQEFHRDITDLVDRQVLPKTHTLDSAQQILHMNQLMSDKQVQIDTLALQKAQLAANHALYLTRTEGTLEQYKHDKSRLEKTILSIQKQQLISVKATRNGHITALPKRASEHFTPQTTLSVIKPLEQNIFVDLYLPHSQKGKVKLGTLVNLELSSFTPNEFGFIRGKVVDLHQTSQEQANGLNFDTVVVSLPRELPEAFSQEILQTGMLVKGNVLLKNQPIWRWCFSFVSELLGNNI